MLAYVGSCHLCLFIVSNVEAAAAVFSKFPSFGVFSGKHAVKAFAVPIENSGRLRDSKSKTAIHRHLEACVALPRPNSQT